MHVKKTRTGKFSVMMSYELRLAVWELIVNFLESEMAKLIFIKIEKDLMRHVYANVLQEIVTVKNFHLHANWETRIHLKKSEALALVWLMGDVKAMEIINLKGELHKLLS